MSEKILILGGYIMCDSCSGSGRIYIYNVNGSIDKKNTCEVCGGQGIRKPTWTEQIKFKDVLKECNFNFGDGKWYDG